MVPGPILVRDIVLCKTLYFHCCLGNELAVCLLAANFVVCCGPCKAFGHRSGSTETSGLTWTQAVDTLMLILVKKMLKNICRRQINYKKYPVLSKELSNNSNKQNIHRRQNYAKLHSMQCANRNKKRLLLSSSEMFK